MLFASLVIAGTVWHRTHFQLGLNVLDWGDGMLVVTDKGTDRGSVLITTFGLDEEVFSALEARWCNWWAERYSGAT